MNTNLLETTNAVDRMKKLIFMISDAAEAYYVDDNPYLTDKQYDELCDELESLEQASGIVLANSPLHKVMGGVAEGFEKVVHSEPMLSAAKTKDVDVLVKFADNKPVCISWKEDGISLVCIYEGGKLAQAVTRGDGHIGEDVTENAKTITNLPLQIPYKEHLEVRGECLISWITHKTLKRIAESKGESIGHPRNIASGALRQLDPKKAAEKCLEFKAFNCITQLPDVTTKTNQLAWLQANGFDVVEWMEVPFSKAIPAVIESMNPEQYPYPVDGLVVEYNDLAYGKSLGITAHHPKCMMALKWKDETEETVFRGVALNVTRTGTVSLTAEFDSVVIDNTTISNATLHNVDYFNTLELGVGDTITIYKANAVIPAVDENLTRSGTYKLPTHCPECGTELVLDGVFLKCPHKSCPAQLVGRLTHFASKQAMDIHGLSESTIEALVSVGIIQSYADIYKLGEHRKEIINMNGFGSRKFAKLVEAVESSKQTRMYRFIVALGIPFIGVEAAKELEDFYQCDYKQFLEDVKANHIRIKGFGDVMKQNLYEWANDEEAQSEADAVLHYITFKAIAVLDDAIIHTEISGKKICVTGSFDGINREEIKETIRKAGATHVDSVSKTTDILVAGEKAGSKLSKAQSLGIQIMTLEELREVASIV